MTERDNHIDNVLEPVEDQRAQYGGLPITRKRGEGVVVGGVARLVVKDLSDYGVVVGFGCVGEPEENYKNQELAWEKNYKEKASGGTILVHLDDFRGLSRVSIVFRFPRECKILRDELFLRDQASANNS